MTEFIPHTHTHTDRDINQCGMRKKNKLQTNRQKQTTIVE